MLQRILSLAARGLGRRAKQVCEKLVECGDCVEPLRELDETLYKLVEGIAGVAERDERYRYCVSQGLPRAVCIIYAAAYSEAVRQALESAAMAYGLRERAKAALAVQALMEACHERYKSRRGDS